MSDSVIRVVFIEDDGAARTGYTEYLEAKGYNVIPTSNGTDGLTAALTLSPDVVVLDLGLPDIDGWEVARQLKASTTTAHVPVIALTAADLPHERASAMRAGCDWHLTKPCAPEDLVVAIRHSLGR